jgi:hypothetical protein
MLDVGGLRSSSDSASSARGGNNVIISSKLYIVSDSSHGIRNKECWYLLKTTPSIFTAKTGSSGFLDVKTASPGIFRNCRKIVLSPHGLAEAEAEPSPVCRLIWRNYMRFLFRLWLYYRNEDPESITYTSVMEL